MGATNRIKALKAACEEMKAALHDDYDGEYLIDRIAGVVVGELIYMYELGVSEVGYDETDTEETYTFDWDDLFGSLWRDLQRDYGATPISEIDPDDVSIARMQVVLSCLQGWGIIRVKSPSFLNVGGAYLISQELTLNFAALLSKPWLDDGPHPDTLESVPPESYA